MEVVTKKQIHHHLVPMLVLSVALFIGTLMLAFHFSFGQLSTSQLLTERWFTISPTKNGLFEINRTSNQPVPTQNIGDISIIGESAQLQTSVYIK